MKHRQVMFGVLVMLAASLNFGFILGDIADPNVHNFNVLIAALVVSLLTTMVKFSERSHIDAVQIATSLVTNLHLLAAVTVWAYASNISSYGLTHQTTATIVSLAGGALLANVLSAVLLVGETVYWLRH